MTTSHQVMVELDAILDTRIGTVSVLDAALACVLVEGEYAKRSYDFFKTMSSVFTAEQYETAYKNRSHNVLEQSTETPMLDFVGDMILSQMQEKTSPISEQTYCIILNTAPYNLMEHEKAELRTLLSVKIPMAHQVNVVSIPMQWLTPDYFRANRINTYITYSAKDWLQLFHPALEKTPMQSFHLVGPELTDGPVDVSTLDSEDLEVYEKVGPFRAFEMGAVPYLSVRLVPPKEFSTIYTA